jgi:hypothetical protein
MLAWCASPLHAQIARVPDPVVDAGPYVITQRIHVAANGVDSDPGTPDRPKQSLRAALDAIPWPTSGALYAEIVMASGTYRQGLVMQEDDWRRGSRERNVSIRGEGTVVIDAFAMPLVGTQGVITVGGRHIRVSNVAVRRSAVAGVTVAPHSSHVIVENVRVDTCVSHGIYVNLSDTVLVRNCTVVEACRYKVGASDRTWGSCIKLLYSRDVIVRSCTVRDGWGEGINVNRTENVLIERNDVSNVFAGGVYVDMGAVVTVRGNLIHFDPDDPSHWRFDSPAAGISLSNELHCGFNNDCLDAIWTGTNDCRYTCTGLGCSYQARMNDSVEIVDNIVLNANGAVEIFELFNTDCFRTIRIVHNTYAGSTGRARGSALTVLLDMLVREVRGIEIRGNLFLVDDAGIAAGMPACRFADNLLAPIRGQITVRDNGWNLKPTCDLTDPSDRMLNHRFAGIDATQLDRIDPLNVPAIRFVIPNVTGDATDYLGRRRWTTTTAGAIHGLDPTSVALDEPPFPEMADSWVGYDLLGRECARGVGSHITVPGHRGPLLIVYTHNGSVYTRLIMP